MWKEIMKSKSVTLTTLLAILAPVLFFIIIRTLKTRVPEAVAGGIAFWVFAMLLYPFVKNTDTKPPIAYLWRDRKVTLARYAFVMTGLLTLALMSEIIIRAI